MEDHPLQWVYVATVKSGSMWNSFYMLNTKQARAITGSIKEAIDDTDESEKFLSDVKNIINQQHE